MANNKNPNQKQPGEKEPGTFHPIRKSNGIAIQVLLGGSHQDPRKSFGAASRTIRTLSVQSAEKTPSSRNGAMPAPRIPCGILKRDLTY